MHRRQLLRCLRSGLVLSSTAWAASPLLADDGDDRPVALLLPLTGPRAALGLSMRQAATLAENDGKLIAFDTAGTPQGAAAAAARAVDRDAALILGPLMSADVAPVVGAAGTTPVIAFTNDAAVRSSGAFVFGITAGQVTTAILGYARSRGVRSVAVIGDGSAWADAAAAEADRLQGTLGMEARAITVRADAPLPLAGEAPDAVFVPGGGETALAIARNLKPTGIQLLGTLEMIDHRPDALEALDGAWIASPDPRSFGGFANNFQARHGGRPGAIAALAYDAANIAAKLRAANRLDREGVLGSDGFSAVTGEVRFRTDGSVAREFAILEAAAGGYRKVATSRGA
ncbi:ABC transporter substrate-binding protein [Stakelama saccharophila]|uniref:ABC transporter substrate-binding protein n=1 Tax=Stakelama saccharophila TaxID=3075605 RepID=A0ABZ0BCM2_9SPHN|nr:ABC transporter substrate-binding protein [Stakelama sp. W311]WNO54796.1 ABC transporter substrate-binding protein [Stakelama sp. W311]